MYQDPRGGEPVSEWLQALGKSAGKKAQAKVVRAIDLLKTEGLALAREYLHKIPGDLWELRATFQRNPYRVLFYNPSARTLVLLHAFHKKTDAIAKGDLDRATSRMQDDRRRRR